MKRCADSIKSAIFEYGVVKVNGKSVFAYEVNGKGDSKTFDDANLPSLLSLPYLQFIDMNS
jgi:meiotically up-regulated gene 157 (Mug157) protein